MNTQHIIGQSLLMEKMDQIIVSSRIVHAYLFTGPAGAGKKTLSSLFAQALVCEGQGDKPCYSCLTCKQFTTGNHPDIGWIRREKDKTVISINQIRDLQADLKIKPYQAGKRIYFIEQAHTMTEQAQNALLKTLEEPPPHTLIFLLADNTNALLPTIISRCQIFRVGSISRKDVSEIIINRLSLSQDEALTFAGLSQGVPGRGLALAENEEFRSLRERLIEGMCHIGGSLKILDLTEIFTQNKDRFDDLLDILILWFRDILVLSENEGTELIINMDKITLLQKQVKLFTTRALKDIIESIEKSRKIIKGNGNYQLTIENMLLGFQGGHTDAARSRYSV